MMTDGVGLKVSDRRRAAGVSQSDVAMAIGRSQNYVSAVERGLVKPSADVVERIFVAIDLAAKLKIAVRKAQRKASAETIARMTRSERTELRA